MAASGLCVATLGAPSSTASARAISLLRCPSHELASREHSHRRDPAHPHMSQRRPPGGRRAFGREARGSGTPASYTPTTRAAGRQAAAGWRPAYSAAGGTAGFLENHEWWLNCTACNLRAAASAHLVLKLPSAHTRPCADLRSLMQGRKKTSSRKSARVGQAGKERRERQQQQQ